MPQVEGQALSQPGATPFSLRWAALLGAAGAGLIALTVSAQIYLSMLHHGHSWVRIAGWQVCSWSVWAVFAPIVLRLGARLSERSAPPSSRTLRVVGTGLAIVLGHILTASLATVWFQPYVPVQTFGFGDALAGQALLVPTDVVVYVALLVIGASIAVSHRARSLELRESRLEAELARAQLDALRLEIEPHFLFNALNSIGALIRARDGDRALAMLLRLSELLRATVDGRREHTTTLGDEAAFVKQYIELQRARFSDRLDVRYDISAESEAWAVPTFLLQPVVENAFRHGLARRSGPCRLELTASVEGGTLHVRVLDDGAGLPPDFTLADHAGTGLRNTRLRLQRLYDGAAHLDLERAEGGGTLARIRLPAHASAGHRRPVHR